MASVTGNGWLITALFWEMSLIRQLKTYDIDIVRFKRWLRLISSLNYL